MTRKGKISVETSDILPIIKKWLYSEHDIFIRELVANSTDAITKRIANARLKNQNIPEGKIEITVSKQNKTIIIEDNGIGMTENEVEKYIAQLAFSGAKDFMEKIKDEKNKDMDIIGKFGLGFYSCFMVASEVSVNSLSMQDKASPTNWISKGEVDYTFEKSDKKEVGTTITLKINEDKECEEFLNVWKLSDILRKYCDFMPYTIKLVNADDKKKDSQPIIINEAKPLWKRNPKEIKDDEYKEFFRKLFPMEQEPLFWIHLKVDHPFTLEGILYFPKINNKVNTNNENIKLYCKQMFVSHNLKNIIPEFLSLLKGVIDSPDIPLNVSRSSLQGDPNVLKVSNYVVRKVGESLKKLFKNDRKKYENIWEDTGLFIKYGCISDTKFDEIMRNMIIFKNSSRKYITLPEYKDLIPEKYKEKMKNKVLYFELNESDNLLRSQLLDEKIEAIDTDDHIDPHFIQHVEVKKIGDDEYKFSTIDSEISNILETESISKDDTEIKELFKKFLLPPENKDNNKKDSNVNSMDIEIQKIKSHNSAAYFKSDEQMKRFSKMTRSMNQSTSTFPVKKTLVINPNNPLIRNALKIHHTGKNEALVEKICHYVEDLATISSHGLENKNKEVFVKRSQELLCELTEFAT